MDSTLRNRITVLSTGTEPPLDVVGDFLRHLSDGDLEDPRALALDILQEVWPLVTPPEEEHTDGFVAGVKSAVKDLAGVWEEGRNNDTTLRLALRSWLTTRGEECP